MTTRFLRMCSNPFSSWPMLLTVEFNARSSSCSLFIHLAMDFKIHDA